MLGHEQELQSLVTHSSNEFRVTLKFCQHNLHHIRSHREGKADGWNTFLYIQSIIYNSNACNDLYMCFACSLCMQSILSHLVVANKSTCSSPGLRKLSLLCRNKLAFALLPCPVHLCYSPALSQGPAYSQPHQLLQLPSVEYGLSTVKMYNKHIWTTFTDKGLWNKH